jgi:hypothetical protein
VNRRTGVLGAPKGSVPAIEREKIRVRPALNYLTRVKHEYFVRVDHG